jgi:hypothetical protein
MQGRRGELYRARQEQRRNSDQSDKNGSISERKRGYAACSAGPLLFVLFLSVFITFITVTPFRTPTLIALRDVLNMVEKSTHKQTQVFRLRLSR